MENVVINIKELIKNELSPNQYFFIKLLYNEKNHKYILDYVDKVRGFSKSELQDLVDKDFIELIDKDGRFSIENIKVIKSIGEYEEDWFDEWFNLFPEGKRNGAGLYLRSDKLGSRKKMAAFIKENPEIHKDTIINATKNYLNKQRINNYSYCKIAPYFISKDRLSLLLSECENNGKDAREKEPGFLQEI